LRPGPLFSARPPSALVRPRRKPCPECEASVCVRVRVRVRACARERGGSPRKFAGRGATGVGGGVLAAAPSVLADP